MKLRTWHMEAAAVYCALASGVLAFGHVSDWREWLAALGVALGFHHASISNRLQEAEEFRAPVGAVVRTFSSAEMETIAPGWSHRVECVRWLNVYWLAKEAAWVAYFLATGAVAPLVGCAVFLAYPFWRRWYRRLNPLSR